MNYISFYILNLITFSFCFTNATFAQNLCLHKFKVGVSLPLSAGAVVSGEAVRNSIVLASEKFDKHKCVEFIFEDDQLLAKNTVINVNKLINIKKVDALIIYGTPTSIAVTPIAEANKIPMIALSILKKVVEGKNYILKHWCTAENLNNAVLNEVDKRKYKNVAIVSTQNDAMLGLRDLFKAENKEKVVLDEEYQRDQSDLRSKITKIASLKPDAVYVLLYPPQTGVFMKQLRELGYKGEAFGVHNIEDPNEVKVSAGAMEGMWFVNADESAPGDYPNDYKKRFNVMTALGGASGYDSAKMIIEASMQNLDLNTYLHRLKNFEGAFGVYSSTEENDFDFEAVIKIVEDGKFSKKDLQP